MLITDKPCSAGQGTSTLPFGPKPRSTRRGGFTLIEILLVVGTMIVVTTLAIGGYNLFQRKFGDRSVAVRIKQVDSQGKQGLRDNFFRGITPVPDGLTIATIGTYSPTLEELAPFMKLPGYAEGATTISETDIVGPGRTLVIGTLDQDTTCDPPLDRNLVGTSGVGAAAP